MVRYVSSLSAPLRQALCAPWLLVVLNLAGCTALAPVPAPAPAPVAVVPEPPPVVEEPVVTPVEAPARSPFPHFVELGLCEDYPEESRSLEAARADLALARETGAGLLRVGIGWDAIEATPGTYDWSFWDEFVKLAVEEYGMRLLPYVCYTPEWAASEAGPDFWRSPPADVTDFQRFMQVISARYAEWIDVWELWNEPDNAEYWRGDAADFAALVKAGSAGVREGLPGATVVLGGLAWDLDFLRELLAEHDVAPAIDVVNVHSYFETWHEHPIELLAQYLDDAARLIYRLGEGEPLWMAEVGYSSRGIRPGVTEFYRTRYRTEHTADYQASALARTLLVSLASGRLSALAWYRINDLPPSQEVIGDDRNRFLGIVDVKRQPKPAYGALQWLAQVFDQRYRLSSDEAIALAEGADTIELRVFDLEDGRRLVGCWIPAAAAASGSGTAEDPRRAQVEVNLPRYQGEVVETFRTPALQAAQEVRTRPLAATEGMTLEFDLTGGEVMLVLLE